MAQNMAWNTGMKLQKRATKYHINPPTSEMSSLKKSLKGSLIVLEHVKSQLVKTISERTSLQPCFSKQMD